jgi:transcriptional regulator GlxA family with amidase domain
MKFDGHFSRIQAVLLRPGMRAATHWKGAERLRALGIDVAEQRWTRDGAIWFSAGVSAGMDLLLDFIAHEAGETAAGTVQFNAEYYQDGRRYGAAHHDPQATVHIRALP